MGRDSVIRQMHRQGALEWPALVVPFEAYWGHCERLFGGSLPSVEAQSHGASIYLCCACANGDALAVRAFEQVASAVVQGAIVRIHREPEFVRETLQEFWQKMLSGPDAKVLAYQGRGPLQAWLRVAAASLAIDRQRAERAFCNRVNELGESLLEQSLGPESALTRAQFREPFRTALNRAVSALPHRDRNVLRMHVLGRCSIDQIGRAYSVHRATAARWLEHTRERLLSSVRAELKHGDGTLTDSEFQSVARIVCTGLEIEIPPVSVETTHRESLQSH